jgi:uridine kinase
LSQVELKMQDGKSIFANRGDMIYDVINNNNLCTVVPIVLACINRNYYELTSPVNESGIFRTIDITEEIGSKVYLRTLQFVLISSVLKIFPKATVTIEHSLGYSIFGEIHKESELNTDDIEAIKSKMIELINKNILIKKISVPKKTAVDIFTKYGMEDKVRLLKYVNSHEVKLYELDGRYDYFYGSMAYSTGILKTFDLEKYESGFILKHPTLARPFEVAEFISHKKLSHIFAETERWGDILGVADVGSLNDKVMDGDIVNIVRVSEALHEKKIANIADMINEKRDVKIVLIAGPTSSGKTTFSKRLGIQLRVNGLMPVPISLDDYFLNREDTPLDEKGNYDFESLNALDLKLFNTNLQSLLKGEEAELPIFNFKAGRREKTGYKMKLPKNGIILIEGIHGLNETLTSSISIENKFSIYISALTQLNLDNHNRIATTDVRILRRIVRDYLSRGYGGEDTLKMWPSIRKGEEKNIFVYQENADVMFNSTLIYELCVLKKYALAELNKINGSSSVYYEALRLKSFLHFFKDVDMSVIPDNSILREFTGGSCFYKY